MEAEFWHERWRTERIAFHQGRVNTMLERHHGRLGLREDECVFVPLCGKAFDLLWLRRSGQRVLGVELSETAVRSFFNENELTYQIRADDHYASHEGEGVELLCGDLFDLTTSRLSGVSAIYDRAALIALPPAMRDRYVRHVAQIQPQAAVTLLITIEYPPHQIKGPPFCVTPDEVLALYEPTHAVEHIDSREGLDNDDGLAARGLTELTEHAFLLRPLPDLVTT